MKEQIILLQDQRVVWLASYPRSGNTLLRSILRHCFKLFSASIYPNDLGEMIDLENQVGHIRYDEGMKNWLQESSKLLVKTHEIPHNNRPAIYVVRNGWDVCVSMWEFYQRKVPLDVIIAGHHNFGTWSDHLYRWRPWERPNTLLLRYEDMLDDLPRVIKQISSFLDVDSVSCEIPKRNELASASGGRWVRRKGNLYNLFTSPQRSLYNVVNGEMTQMMGYSESPGWELTDATADLSNSNCLRLNQ